MVEIFGQRLEPADVAVIGLLIVLEGVLSIDNALVLGILAKRLPKHQQSRALTYGLVGALVFRLIAIATATYLLKWRVVKLLGGGYLVWVAVKHFFFEKDDEHADQVVAGAEGEPKLVHAADGSALSRAEEELEAAQRSPTVLPRRTGGKARVGFWPTVFVIEMTDIAFAVDSILAAIALVGSAPMGHTGLHPKLWVVVTGGFLGVVLMRFAAVVFIKLLERFPRFEISAYLLVLVIGGKLLADWGFNSPEHPHRVDFHSLHSPAFWIFWVLMLACFGFGFLPEKKTGTGEAQG
jgi:YkoY family integral membrane protein